MKKNTILWADDDADDLQMMREILLRNNQDVDLVEVGNGREALEHLKYAREKDNLPCLIILDINMPVLDGKETLSILKNSPDFKHIPTVIFTTSESELDRLYCHRFHTEMISKPPNFSTLETTIVRLLGFALSMKS